jgi:hypothetical protein
METSWKRSGETRWKTLVGTPCVNLLKAAPLRYVCGQMKPAEKLPSHRSSRRSVVERVEMTSRVRSGPDPASNDAGL